MKNSKIIFIKLFLCLLSFCVVQLKATEIDTLNYTLEEFIITTQPKEDKPLDKQPITYSSISISQIEREEIKSPKDLSSHIPNLHIPDYGSGMTSSIYIRGLGARIDQPAVGLIVDNIPYLNKNNYDFDYFDLERIEMLRGPQGTLYGRNTMGGVMHLHSISPFYEKNMRFQFDYSTANTIKAKVSLYRNPSDKLGYSIAGNFNHTNGFFTNTYTSKKCDKSNGGSLRGRILWKATPSFTIENTLNINLLKQGGYAYALLDEKTFKPQEISYNDPCGYNRFSLIEGVIMQLNKEKFVFSSTTSYQYLDDEMTLDQDFQPLSLFTLKQAQKEHAITEELTIRNRTPNKVWDWKFGVWGFFKHNRMSAPVLFKKDGINELILANANKGIQTVFPDDALKIKENEFLISSEFQLPTYGVAAYHQSEFHADKWDFIAGIRVDYENAQMEYQNEASLHYLFSLIMNDYKALKSSFEGKEKKHFFEILPKIAIQYNINNQSNLYASVTKGYKSGGFNTQIFSDLLQNRLMNDMMNDMGIHMDGMGTSSYNSAEVTGYDPEYNWNYEIGTHLDFNKINLLVDFALFYIDIRDQQLTVFPQGKNTGRMMTNAGKSRSIGGELSLTYRIKDFLLNGSYGHTTARFVEFNDGKNSYNGNYVPFVPQNTASLTGQYTFFVNKKLIDRLMLSANWKGVGMIYWDEGNRVVQPFYSQLGATLALQKGDFEIKCWGKNLTNTNYTTFYFVSIGNRFCQRGKPRQIGVSLIYEF